MVNYDENSEKYFGFFYDRSSVERNFKPKESFKEFILSQGFGASVGSKKNQSVEVMLLGITVLQFIHYNERRRRKKGYMKSIGRLRRWEKVKQKISRIG